MLRIAVASPVRPLPALPANGQHSGDARFFGCRGRPCDDRLAIEEKALGPDHPCSPPTNSALRGVAQLRSGEEEPAACIDHRPRATGYFRRALCARTSCSAAHLLTRNEARRIAANVAKLPDLLGRRAQPRLLRCRRPPSYRTRCWTWIGPRMPPVRPADRAGRRWSPLRPLSAEERAPRGRTSRMCSSLRSTERALN
jgi:hypothetical protein